MVARLNALRLAGRLTPMSSTWPSRATVIGSVTGSPWARPLGWHHRTLGRPGVGTLAYARTGDHRPAIGPGGGGRGSGAGDRAGGGRRPPGRHLRDQRGAVPRAAGLLRPGQDQVPDPARARVVRRGRGGWHGRGSR